MRQQYIIHGSSVMINCSRRYLQQKYHCHKYRLLSQYTNGLALSFFIIWLNFSMSPGWIIFSPWFASLAAITVAKIVSKWLQRVVIDLLNSTIVVVMGSFLNNINKVKYTKRDIFLRVHIEKEERKLKKSKMSVVRERPTIADNG